MLDALLINNNVRKIIIKEIKNRKFFLYFSFIIKKYINFNEQEKKTARTGSEQIDKKPKLRLFNNK